jgi:hypothetical protein
VPRKKVNTPEEMTDYVPFRSHASVEPQAENASREPFLKLQFQASRFNPLLLSELIWPYFKALAHTNSAFDQHQTQFCG